MSETKGGLQSDQLFIGLTRPAMVAGVHYIIFMLNFIFTVLLFINLDTEGKLWQIPLVAFIIHMAAYLVCLKEPRAIELLMVRYGKCSRCKNRVYHKYTNSYDVV
jgi:type IV secretion system protein VirB3